MEDHAGIVRTKEELERGLVVLEGLKQRARHVRVSGSRHYNPGWHYAIDLRAMGRSPCCGINATLPLASA